MLAMLLGAQPRLPPLDAAVDANNVWSQATSTAAAAAAAAAAPSLRWPLRLSSTVAAATLRWLLVRARPPPLGVGAPLAFAVCQAMLTTLAAVAVDAVATTPSDVRRFRRRDAVVDQLQAALFVALFHSLDARTQRRLAASAVQALHATAAVAAAAAVAVAASGASSGARWRSANVSEKNAAPSMRLSMSAAYVGAQAADSTAAAASSTRSSGSSEQRTSSVSASSSSAPCCVNT